MRPLTYTEMDSELKDLGFMKVHGKRHLKYVHPETKVMVVLHHGRTREVKTTDELKYYRKALKDHEQRLSTTSTARGQEAGIMAAGPSYSQGLRRADGHAPSR